MSADTATAAASAAADDLDIVIAHTLQLLQRRLRRIEFLITGGLTHDSTDRNDNGSGDDSSDGDNDDSGTKIKMDKNKNKKLKKQSVKQGLRSINASLQNLSARSAGVRQILELHNKHPRLLKPAAYDEEFDVSNERNNDSNDNASPQDRQLQIQSGHISPDNNNVYPISQQLALVLSISQTYTHTASQLTLLQDLHVPPTAPLADLAALRPRLAQIQQVQARQEAEVMALAKRTGVLLLRWYDGSVIGGGRCWVDWEGRLREVEKVVRRTEVRREKERKDEGR